MLIVASRNYIRIALPRAYRLYMRFRAAEKDLAALEGEPQDETHASVLG